MGFPSLWAKFKLPYYFLMFLAYICSAIGWLLGIKVGSSTLCCAVGRTQHALGSFRLC